MFNTIFTNRGPAIHYCEGCKDLYINYTIVPSNNSRIFYDPATSPPSPEIKKVWEENRRLEEASLRPSPGSFKNSLNSNLPPIRGLETREIEIKPKLKLDFSDPFNTKTSWEK